MQFKKIIIVLIFILLNLANAQGEDFKHQMDAGEQFFMTGDFKNAAASLEKCIDLLNMAINPVEYLDAAMFLSRVYLAMGYHQRALKVLEKTRPIIESSKDRYWKALYFNTLADVHLSLGNIEPLVTNMTQAIENARAAKNTRILALTLNNLGNALAAEGNFQEALGAYDECLEIVEDMELKIRTLLNVTRAFYASQDYARALTTLEVAHQFIEDLPDNHNKAANLISLSLLAEDIRAKVDFSLQKIKPKEKLTFKTTSTENYNYNVVVDIPQKYAISKSEKFTNSIYFDLGQTRISKQSMTTLKKLSRLLKQKKYQYFYIHLVGFTDSVGIRKTNQKFKSNLDLSQKRVEEIEQYLLKHLPNIEKINSKNEIWAYSIFVGTYPEKEAALNAATIIKNKHKVKTFIKEKIYLRGKKYLLYVGEYGSEKIAAAHSQKLFKRAYPIDTKSYAAAFEIKTLNEKILFQKEAKGSLPATSHGPLAYLGEYKNRKVVVTITALFSQKAKQRFYNVETQTKTDQNKRFLTDTGLNAIKDETIYEKDIVTHLREFAYQTLQTAEKIGEKLKDGRITSQAWGHIGKLLEKEKRFDTAVRMTRRAVLIAGQGNWSQILYQWQWQLGRLFKAQGQMQKAIEAYRRAVETLTPINSKLFFGYRSKKDTFTRDVKPVYLELAQLFLLRAENTKQESAKQDLLLQARDVMEQLKSFELQDFFQDACVIEKTKRVTLDRSAPQTAVIYPIPLPDYLVLLLTLPDGIKQIKTMVDYKTLSKTITHFRKQLQTRTDARYLYDAKQLYNWIIRPMEADLDAHEVKTLIIAPDGVLRLIPFATLHDGSQFLVENYAMVTIPAVTLMDPKPIDQEDALILVAGLSESVQGFSGLPSVEAELRDINKIMNGRVILKNDEFNIPNLACEFTENAYSIVHLATHGVFGGSPEETYLLTYDEKMVMKRLKELIELGKYRKNKVELLVMSACQTALGNERAALGLSGVAISAGVRSVLATLWFVDDEATSLATREFYRQLITPGNSRAQALQKAQKMLIRQARYRHPLYWAPFLLIGNWM